MSDESLTVRIPKDPELRAKLANTAGLTGPSPCRPLLVLDGN